jgi:hypothetical protein
MRGPGFKIPPSERRGLSSFTLVGLGSRFWIGRAPCNYIDRRVDGTAAAIEIAG